MMHRRGSSSGKVAKCASLTPLRGDGPDVPSVGGLVPCAVGPHSIAGIGAPSRIAHYFLGYAYAMPESGAFPHRLSIVEVTPLLRSAGTPSHRRWWAGRAPTPASGLACATLSRCGESSRHPATQTRRARAGPSGSWGARPTRSMMLSACRVLAIRGPSGLPPPDAPLPRKHPPS